MQQSHVEAHCLRLAKLSTLFINPIMPNSSAKPLIVFDIDGTLSGGESYDWTTFEEAFPEVTGAPFEGWVLNHNEGQAVDSP